MDKLFKYLAMLTDIECMNYCEDQLRRYHYYIERQSKYLIAEPKRPNFQSAVALVAHCDTVSTHRTNGRMPRKFIYRDGIISVKGGGVLGADDRAGVAAILKIIHDGQRPHVYLTMDEEIGAVGADHFVADYPDCPNKGVNVLLQIDRHGNDDFVTYDCDSKDLNKWVSQFGWKEAIGSFSDISTLCPQWGIAGANLSCGYYDEHSNRECLIIPELETSIRRIKRMLDNPPPAKLEYIRGQYSYWSDLQDYYSHYGQTSTNSTGDSIEFQGNQVYRCSECRDYFEWEEMDFENWLCEDCKEEMFQAYSGFLNDRNDDGD